MDIRSTENLRSARILMETTPSCPNASATRAYFAAYQKCVALLTRMDEHPPQRPDGLRYWPHLGFSETVADILKLGDEAGELDMLLALRIQADYHVDPVTMDDARDAVDAATSFIGSMQSRWP